MFTILVCVRWAGLKIAAAVAVAIAACLSLLLRAERECTASLPAPAAGLLRLSSLQNVSATCTKHLPSLFHSLSFSLDLFAVHMQLELHVC